MDPSDRHDYNVALRCWRRAFPRPAIKREFCAVPFFVTDEDGEIHSREVDGIEFPQDPTIAINRGKATYDVPVRITCTVKYSELPRRVQEFFGLAEDYHVVTATFTGKVEVEMSADVPRPEIKVRFPANAFMVQPSLATVEPYRLF